MMVRSKYRILESERMNDGLFNIGRYKWIIHPVPKISIDDRRITDPRITVKGDTYRFRCDSFVMDHRSLKL